jgi:uncharacterized membrane protein
MALPISATIIFTSMLVATFAAIGAYVDWEHDVLCAKINITAMIANWIGVWILIAEIVRVYLR